MNDVPRLCATALLVALIPGGGVVAQEQSQDAQDAATAPPKSEPVTGPSATPNPQGDPTRREADEAVDAIRGYSAELRDQAMASAKRAADDLDRQMARLQAQTDERWERMSEAARTSSQATMSELRQRRNALAEWYGGMRHSSAAAWGEVRTGFVTSYHELADALRKARAEFAKDEKPAAEKPADDEKR